MADGPSDPGLTEAFLDWYVANRHRPELAELTDYLLTAALSARGYNNRRTGEDFFIEKILAPEAPRLCIDIGANVGRYSLMLLQETGADVIAFEPLASAFAELERTTAGFAGRIRCENCGVGDREGVLPIHFDPAETVLASFSEEAKKVDYVANGQTAAARLVTLDGYCREKGITAIDLVKIDTEGFEAEVFAGAEWVFSRIRPRFIQMEFNWHQMFRSRTLYDFSECLPGYDVYQLLPGGWAQRAPTDPLANFYQVSNFVFVRAG